MAHELAVFKNLTRQYVVGSNIVNALNDVNGSVVANRHVAIMGTSGSGKSTLLAMLAGLDRPDGGEISWPTLKNHAALRPSHVSVSFQSPSLLPSLTVKQNVEVPLLIADESKFEARAADALERLRLAHLANRYPDEISGGQAQRVALARAMAAAPKLLLADEPTGQLDHETGRGVINALQEWAEDSDCTLVVATHDPQVAQHFTAQWRMIFGVLTAGESK